MGRKSKANATTTGNDAAQALLSTARPAHQVQALDALGQLDRPLGALRAIESLTECYSSDAERYLPMLKRPDLSSLLTLVADEFERVYAETRQAIDLH